MATTTETPKAAPSRDYRAEVTADLIARIEAGTAPWQKPWNPQSGAAFQMPFNATTGRAYRGGNAIHLMLRAAELGSDDPRWLTFKQAKAQNFNVKRGSKGTSVEYWKFEDEQERVDPATGKVTTERVRLQRPEVFFGVVFHASQIDGIPEFTPAPMPEGWNPVREAERILAGSGIEIAHDQADRAFYRPSSDTIHMPPMAAFPTPADYYEVALHEQAHSTGHASRMNRDLSGAFGSESYAREELRAQIASMYLAMEIGIPFNPDRHAAYNASWLKVLANDKHEIFRAARDAEAIADHVLSMALERNVEELREQTAVAQLEAPAPVSATPEPAVPVIPETRTEYPLGELQEDTFNPRFFGSRVRVHPEMDGDVAWEGTVHNTLKHGRLIEVLRDDANSTVRIAGQRIEVLALVDAQNTVIAPMPSVHELFERARENPPSNLPDSVTAAQYAITKIAGRISERPSVFNSRWSTLEGYSIALHSGTGQELSQLMEDALLLRTTPELERHINEANRAINMEPEKHADQLSRSASRITTILDRNELRITDVEAFGGDESIVASARSLISNLRKQAAHFEQQAVDIRQALIAEQKRESERLISPAAADNFKKTPTSASIKGWRTGERNGNLVYTNGHILDLNGTPPHMKGWEKHASVSSVTLSADAIDRVIPPADNIAKMTPLEVIAKLDNRGSKTSSAKHLVLMSRGHDDYPVASFDSTYISYFQSKYPQAQFFAEAPQDGKQGHELDTVAVVMQDKEVVGVVMPFRLNSGLTPAHIRDILARNELEAKLSEPISPEIASLTDDQLLAELVDPVANDVADTLLTVEQAKQLLVWQDMGVNEGVKSHRLFFYESAEAMRANTGRMQYGSVTKGDVSDTKWHSHSDATTHETLQAARKAAIEHALSALVKDGYVEPAAPASDDITPRNDTRTAFMVEGRSVYPTFIREGDKLLPYWAVQSQDNIALKGRQTGDSLHKTMELAERAAIHEAREAAERATVAAQEAQAQEQVLQQELSKGKDNLNGFAIGKPPVAVGKIKKTLNAEASINGKNDTIRNHIERFSRTGDLSLTTVEVDKIKPMNSTEFFKASHAEQVEHEKKVKAGGKKTIYLVNNYDLGKIAYDYAQHLVTNKTKERTKSTDLFIAPATRPTLLFADLSQQLTPDERLGIAQRLSAAIEQTEAWQTHMQDAFGNVDAYLQLDANLSILPIPIKALLADEETVALAKAKGLTTYTLVNEESGSVLHNKIRPTHQPVKEQAKEIERTANNPFGLTI